MLEIRNLTKMYGNKKAVDNLSLTVNDGEICAFIGHNGAGKTTTLKAIAGIISCEKGEEKENACTGEIFVNGLSVETNPMEVKRQIAYLPDNPDIYEHLKGIDYLNFIADVFGMSKAERKEKIEEFAKKLDIYNDLNSVVSSYSHGMKQKLALVSALIHSPKLLLLDEPFVGLDPICAHTVKEIMKDMAKNGATIFYSTHVLEVAEKLCNKVAIIKNGKLVVCDEMSKVKGMKSLESIFLELEDEKHD